MIDVTGQPDVAKAYAHLGKRQSAGKGDAPRNCWSDDFRRGWERIFGKRRQRKDSK